MKKTKRPKKIVAVHKRVRHHVKMAVVPHAKNQFRPHLVRGYGIATVLVLVATLVFGSNWLSTGSVLGAEVNITPTSLLNSVNDERTDKGEGVLRYNKQLSQAAFLKAQDMLDKQYWAHNAPDGTTPWQWFGKVDYNYAFAGENLAKNFQSASATVTAWMASQKHRDNVLGQQYTEAGFAVVDGVLSGKQTTLVVALFGRPASSVAGVVAPVENSATLGGLSMMSQFGVTLQSMSPAVLSSLTLLLLTSVVALSAHAYRRQLPLAVRQTWRYHHGLIKATGFAAILIVLVAVYSGGQI